MGGNLESKFYKVTHSKPPNSVILSVYCPLAVCISLAMLTSHAEDLQGFTFRTAHPRQISTARSASFLCVTQEERYTLFLCNLLKHS